MTNGGSYGGLMLYLEMKDCHEIILNNQRPDGITADAWRKKGTQSEKLHS